MDDVIYPLFQEAAIVQKLVKDNMMWIKCMKETNDSYTSIHVLWKLFPSILHKSEVSNYREFSQKCKEPLDTDYTHKDRIEFKNHLLLSCYVFKDWTPPVGFNQNIDCCASSEWTIKTIVSNWALCELEEMLSKEDSFWLQTSTARFPCRTVYSKLSHGLISCKWRRSLTRKGKILFWSKSQHAKPRPKKASDYIKGLIEENNKERNFIFLMLQVKLENIYIEWTFMLDLDARKRSFNISNI